MDTPITRALLIALLVSVVFGVAHGMYTSYLDHKLEAKNPDSYEMADRIIGIRIFSWSRTGIFMLQIFAAVSAILVVNHFIRKKMSD